MAASLCTEPWRPHPSSYRPTGHDVAVETAEIALLSEDLSRLPHLLELSISTHHALHHCGHSVAHESTHLLRMFADRICNPRIGRGLCHDDTLGCQRQLSSVAGRIAK